MKRLVAIVVAGLMLACSGETREKRMERETTSSDTGAAARVRVDSAALKPDSTMARDTARN